MNLKMYVWKYIYIDGQFKHACVLAESIEEARKSLKAADRAMWWYVSGMPCRVYCVDDNSTTVVRSGPVVQPLEITGSCAVVLPGGE